MSKKIHYREADTRLYLTGLELKKPKKGDPLDTKIGIAVKTVDGKYGMYITYETLLAAVLNEANKNLKGGK